MSDPYLGEIRMFGGNFAPRNWALCNGSLLAINDYSALYSLLGTTYGGNGVNNFALPEMRGRIPIHHGTGPGLTPRNIGWNLGSESETLNINQIPSHSHELQASRSEADSFNPAGDVMASQSDGDLPYTTLTDPTKLQTLNSNTIANTGGNLPHSNMMPFQCVTFIICLIGNYPPRT